MAATSENYTLAVTGFSTDAWIQLAFPTTVDYTITGWAYWDGTGPAATPTILNVFTSENTSLMLGEDGQLKLQVGSNTINFIQSPNANTWFFFCITLTATGICTAKWSELYQTTFTDSRTVSLASDGISVVQVDAGANGFTGTAYFSGGIAQLRQWTVVLEDSELIAEKNSFSAFRTANLWSDNPLQGASDTSDSSENGNEVTFTAALSTMAGPENKVLRGQFNCDCDDTNTNETLAELRRRMLVRLGYAAQADNPPPGMADLLNDFLRQAQRFLYRKYAALRTKRIFTWTLIPGIRFYDLPDNDEACDKRLDPNELEWAGIDDTRGIWYELIAGIPPQFYTAVKFLGYPTRYEIRQCIELFPAPAGEYRLRIKGRFGLQAFSADSDRTTIDSELVFMWALSAAKAHYGQPDAASVRTETMAYLRDLNSGLHTTKRYVPGTNPAQPWTQPKFLPLGTS